MNDPRQADTEKLPKIGLDTIFGSPRPWPAATVEVAGMSDTGLVRAKNEDHFLIARFQRSLDIPVTSVPEDLLARRWEESVHGMMVADGVGGSAAGERASQLALTTLTDLVLREPDWIVRAENELLVKEIVRRAIERFGAIRRVMARQVEADPGLRGFATTLTVAWNLNRCLFVAHLGDSRAYLFRQGILHRLTHDHTLAQQLADRGDIPPQAVAKHRLRHVLLKSLNEREEQIEPDISRFVLDDDDCLLLCTDGLTDMVSEEGIVKILNSPDAAEVLCQRLVDEALRAGGKDNVTVVLARYRFPGGS
jgi:protein phosphatase